MIVIAMGAIMSVETFRAMVVGEEAICTECSLEEIDEKIDLMLKGLGTGRTVIDPEK